MSHQIQIISTPSTLSLNIDGWYRQFSASEAREVLETIESVDEFDTWTADDDGHDDTLEAEWAELAESNEVITLRRYSDLTTGAAGYLAEAELNRLATIRGW